MAASAQLLDILGIPISTSSSSTMPQGRDDANDTIEVVRRGLSIASFRRVASYYQLSDV